MFIDISEFQEFIADVFRLQGTLEIIYSELDAVFRLKDAQGDQFAVKCSLKGKDPALLEMELAAYQHLAKSKSFPYQIQRPVFSRFNRSVENFADHAIRIFHWINLPLQADIKPQGRESRSSIGIMAAKMSLSLAEFKHPACNRFIKWNPSEIEWIRPHLSLLDEKWKNYFEKIIDTIKYPCADHLLHCRSSIIYNDMNDYNILMIWNEDQKIYESGGLLDFGDMVYSHTVNELAIACVYSCIKLNDPLEGAMDIVKAYHSIYPLNEHEIFMLYYQILSRLMISLTVSGINRKENPENAYLQVTEEDAWHLIEKWSLISPNFANYAFRSACGLDAHPDFILFKNWALENSFHPITENILNNKNYSVIDFSIDSHLLGNVPDFENTDLLGYKIIENQKKTKTDFSVGGYLECRPIYSSQEYKSIGNEGPEWRSIHLGLDIFDQVHAHIFSPHDGQIYAVHDNRGYKNYGPTLIIKHLYPRGIFYTLYGHLDSATLSNWSKGDFVVAGTPIAKLGNSLENGNWPPHLHFQIILDLDNDTLDFPGVCKPFYAMVYKSLCPDPNLITKLNMPINQSQKTESLLESRSRQLGKNLSISYSKPLWIKRAYMQYLYDQEGQQYLDTVNNVAHCGHQNEHIIEALIKQANVLNTNTRYLHNNILELADSLTQFLDPSLSVCYFVNSGSEANELAIRLAKNYTERDNFLVFQHGYHGNTNRLIDLSSYKFDRKGGRKAPPLTHVIDIPDLFRGKYAAISNPIQMHLDELRKKLEGLIAAKQLPAAFLAEAIVSCGGQIVIPKEYMQSALQLMRNSGILYIADEVQTGLGRTGKFCAYEYNEIVPDIVTFGKPFGNGHPLAAVVTTRAIADKFNNGMEYFNTFGGNPVSTCIGNKVLQIIRDSNYMDHALKVGNYLMDGLTLLKSEYPLIADIRGKGLFSGFECISDLNNHTPATSQAKYLVNRMKEHKILMSTDGPDDNVIKIKPPMCFSYSNADEIIEKLNLILREDYLQVN